MCMLYPLIMRCVTVRENPEAVLWAVLSERTKDWGGFDTAFPEYTGALQGRRNTTLPILCSMLSRGHTLVDEGVARHSFRNLEAAACRSRQIPRSPCYAQILQP